MIYYLNTKTKKSQWEKPETPAEEEDEDSSAPKAVRCSHLLVKHAGSRRPSSWREDNITRTKEEAIELLKGMFLFHSSSAQLSTESH